MVMTRPEELSLLKTQNAALEAKKRARNTVVGGRVQDVVDRPLPAFRVSESAHRLAISVAASERELWKHAPLSPVVA